jgi:hypothetical protein
MKVACMKVACMKVRGVRRGVTTGVEDGRRPPALRVATPEATVRSIQRWPSAGHRRVGQQAWLVILKESPWLPPTATPMMKVACVLRAFDVIRVACVFFPLLSVVASQDGVVPVVGVGDSDEGGGAGDNSGSGSNGAGKETAGCVFPFYLQNALTVTSMPA